MAREDVVDKVSARQRLEELAQDRSALAGGVRVPWGLMTAAGAAVAWFVADTATSHPGASYRPGSGYLVCMAALLIVSHLIHKETGIRFRRAGVRGNLIMAGILALTLVMFMTGLALVSVGLRWLVIGPILVTWAGGTLGAAGVLRSCVEQTSRG